MRIWAFLLLSLVASSAFALPTLEDVEHAVHRGDYAAAESMTREVVSARPNSAKAHYILAEILAHEGKLPEARTQVASARQLDPEIHFTTPDRFRQFEAQLSGKGATRASPAAPRKAAESGDGGGSSGVWIVLLVLGAGAVFLMLRRRPAAPPNYGNSYPANPNGMPGAPGGYGNAGYPPGYAGPMTPPGSGMGGRVAAGLGGVAAGMLAEHLIEGALGQHNAHASEASSLGQSPSAPESLEDRPIDFGNGNDWGGDAGGGDASAGFDSGGSDDWS